MESTRLIQDLQRPEAFGPGVREVEFIETHISWVFLAGDLAYKLKKPVDFGFLDFTSLEKRRFFCQEEVRLNRRLAPDVYQGVTPVALGPDGRAVFGREGDPAVEWAVRMRRMPQDQMMARRLERGEVGPETIVSLANILTSFYKQAETGDRVNQYGRIEVIRHNTDEDFWQTIDNVDVALSSARYDHIQRFNDDFIRERRDLFQRRIDQGWIRDCHGDLHMGNICLDGDSILIFDCIEFNESFRCSDVAADLAFLAMDLDYRGRPDLGRLLTDTYVDLSGDRELNEILDFYKCYRAYVRGKIYCFAFDQPGAPTSSREESLRQARRYFDLAYRYAKGTQRPRVMVFFGLMGSGKTYWAREASRRLGAQLISSDLERKRLAGVPAHSRVYVPFGQGLYSIEMSKKVYQSMHNSAERLTETGLDVVLDASYMRHAEREAVIRVAERAGAEVLFVLVEADRDTVLKRLGRRKASGRSMSDGRPEIYDDQAGNFESPGDAFPAPLARLSTRGPIEETRRDFVKILGLQ